MRSHIHTRVVSRIHRQLLSTMSETEGPIAQRIRAKLLDAFAPVHLDVRNESFMHNVPKGAETHFKVVVVSELFDGKPLLQRHRLVNEALAEELAGGVHALSILGKTPAQWEASGGAVAASPNCLGGMKTDPTKQEFLKSLQNDQSK